MRSRQNLSAFLLSALLLCGGAFAQTRAELEAKAAEIRQQVAATMAQADDLAAQRAPWRMTVNRDPRTNLILSAEIEPVEAAA